MISLISFTSTEIIPLEEAKELNLVYKPCKVGYRDTKLQLMEANDKYLGIDVFKEDEVEGESPTWVDVNGKDVPYYYVYTEASPDEPDYADVRGKHLVDLTKFATICKYAFSIEQSVEESTNSLKDINSILSLVEEKTSNLKKLIDSTTDINFNSKCNVHVGGGLLVTFNDLCLKENTCTDELMKELNDGWRIIAICVQPDQRRPDYVLGRYNPKLVVEDNKEAKR